MFKAEGEYIVIEPVYQEKIGQIIIPDSKNARERISDFYGRILSIGPECSHRNILNVGDKILFVRNEGTPIELDNGKKLIAILPRWVVAKVEEEKDGI